MRIGIFLGTDRSSISMNIYFAVCVYECMYLCMCVCVGMYICVYVCVWCKDLNVNYWFDWANLSELSKFREMILVLGKLWIFFWNSIIISRHRGVMNYIQKLWCEISLIIPQLWTFSFWLWVIWDSLTFPLLWHLHSRHPSKQCAVGGDYLCFFLFIKICNILSKVLSFSDVCSWGTFCRLYCSLTLQYFSKMCSFMNFWVFYL